MLIFSEGESKGGGRSSRSPLCRAAGKTVHFPAAIHMLNGIFKAESQSTDLRDIHATDCIRKTVDGFGRPVVLFAPALAVNSVAQSMWVAFLTRA